jgi:hypothetical protein
MGERSAHSESDVFSAGFFTAFSRVWNGTFQAQQRGKAGDFPHERPENPMVRVG